jgi:putative transposase
VCSGRDGWAVLALVIDCCTRGLLYGISPAAADREPPRRRSSRSSSSSSSSLIALIARFGALGRAPTLLWLRSDYGVVFTSRSYARLVRGYAASTLRSPSE